MNKGKKKQKKTKGRGLLNPAYWQVLRPQEEIFWVWRGVKCVSWRNKVSSCGLFASSVWLCGHFPSLEPGSLVCAE